MSKFQAKLDADSLIYSLGHCECDSHTVRKVPQWHLTADCVVPQESDCSRVRSKAPSDWLPSYIKAALLVLEIFKMAGYFLDRHRILCHIAFIDLLLVMCTDYTLTTCEMPFMYVNVMLFFGCCYHCHKHFNNYHHIIIVILIITAIINIILITF
jgi:hypothetical protein